MMWLAICYGLVVGVPAAVLAFCMAGILLETNPKVYKE